MNSLTFRISKHKRKQSDRLALHDGESSSTARDILKDASEIKKVLSFDKKAAKNANNLRHSHEKVPYTGRANRLNMATINREIRYFATPTI